MVSPIVPDLPQGGAPSVTPLAPDAAAPSTSDSQLFSGFVDALGQAGDALKRADGAEHAFENGTGGLQEMVFERARADALLSVASSAASKATQSLNTILNMQL